MQAPKTPYEMVKKIVEKELGKPIEEVYDYFEEKPLASASLA
jgi:aarF domain-containing kinase